MAGLGSPGRLLRPSGPWREGRWAREGVLQLGVGCQGVSSPPPDAATWTPGSLAEQSRAAPGTREGVA